MVHKSREHGIKDASIDEAARIVTSGIQPLTTGFRLPGALLLLNDSLTEEPGRHQEYAVVRDGETVDSLTVTWMDAARVAEVLTSHCRPFITPPPRVRVNPNTFQWKCPRCHERNDDGDDTCIHCGQDVVV